MKDLTYTAKDTDGCPVTAGSPAFLQRKDPSPGIIVKGWEKLEENNAEKLVKALTTYGPVVTSVIGDDLNAYHGGVIDHCKTTIVDHAVVMLGYGIENLGEDKGSIMYWNIRNSWGKKWGEQGSFRLQRYWPEKPEPCFTDEDPSKGVACKDKEGPEGKYPTSQKACGTCGILMDSSYATGVSVPESLLSPVAKKTYAEAVVAGKTGAGGAAPNGGILSNLPSFNSVTGLHLADAWSSIH
jgi:hypothetical protein